MSIRVVFEEVARGGRTIQQPKNPTLNTPAVIVIDCMTKPTKNAII